MAAFYYVSIIVYFSIHIIFCTASSKERKNVLFIIADDLRPMLGCYGENVITPNIDHLARNSIKFNYAYAQQALCAPSRASFLTSRHPDTTKVYDLFTYWREISGNFTTIPQFFKNNGYNTISIGKVFHNGPASNNTDDFPYSWSQFPYHASTEVYKDAKVCPDYDYQLHKNLVCPVNVKQMPESTLPDIQSTDYAIEFLHNISQNSESKIPFFLGIGYHKPHIPLKYPKEFLKFYPLSQIKPAPDPFYPSKLPVVAWNPWGDLREREDVERLNVSYPFGPLPMSFQLLVRQSYFAATSYIDHLIGQLLYSLQKYKLADNTIIIFLGDHGWSLGEHQEWSKYSNFEVSVRVPLLISVPGLTNIFNNFSFPNPYDLDHSYSSYINNEVKGSSMETNELIELVDLFPTLVELTGFRQLKKCPRFSAKLDICTEGLSLVPLIYNVTRGLDLKRWRRATFSQFPRPADKPQENSDTPLLKDITIMGYSVRTKKYRYTEWVDFDPVQLQPHWFDLHARELYNEHTDPLEDHNLANLPENQKIIKKLSLMLHEGWEGTMDFF